MFKVAKRTGLSDAQLENERKKMRKRLQAVETKIAKLKGVLDKRIVERDEIVKQYNQTLEDLKL